MIKQFRLNRHNKSSNNKSGDRFDFNFFNIQALQVPKGWDKLSVSLISAETGKPTSKSGKASVRNGNCRWTETLSESVWISLDDASQELEECLFKLLVSMGSARSGILGEATVNLAGYASSKASALVSLPLKKCNYGTILQVEIQCLTPRTIVRNEKQKNPNSYNEDANEDYEDVDTRSDMSDGSFNKSVGSSSSNRLSGTSHAGELGSRETSFSVSGSRPSVDSMEDSLGRDSISSQSNLSGTTSNSMRRQDSSESQNSASYGPYPVFESPQSNRLPSNSGTSVSGRHLQNQREDFGRISHASPLRTASSSRTSMEAEEVNIEEHRAEARMWERNARKLMLDQEQLRNEIADQSKQIANLDMELSESQTERDGLKQEIEQLQVLLEESIAKQKVSGNLKLKASDKDDIHKELERERMFQKESNDNLNLQLKKAQESNLELVSCLQEMEETIENQKMEIESLLKSKSGDTDVHARENKGNLELELQELQESQKKLEDTILYMEEKLAEKNHEIQIERDRRTRSLLDCESDWRRKLAVKDEEIAKLEAKLSEFENRDGLDQNEEIKALREKVQELESECAELTDENLELLLKLKESNKDLSSGGASHNSSFKESPADDSPSNFEYKLSKPGSQIWQLEDEMKKRETLAQGVESDNLQIRCNDLESKCAELELQLQDFKALSEEQEAEIVALLQLLENQKVENSGNLTEANADMDNSSQKVTNNLAVENEMEGDNLEGNIRCSSCRGLEIQNKELQSRVEDMGKELFAGNAEIEELKADLLLKEEEIEALKCCQRDLENQISDLQKIEETVEIVQREGKGIKKKNLELESCKNELERNLCELEKENVRLSQQVSGLEAQLRYLTDSQESSRLEAQHSESNAKNLQDEIRGLQNEMEAQKEEMRNKFEEMQKRWLEAQEECKYLKNANPKLQTTAESLIEECNSLQKSNGELREQRLQLGEEIVLKDQLEKIPMLQDEVLALKSSLNEMKFENERLKASLELVSRDYEESKAEKNSLVQRISSMQNVGPDLTATEVLCGDDTELKNELGWVKRTNSQLQRKIKCLEEEKDEYLNKVQTLEEELKQKKGVKEGQTESAANGFPRDPGLNGMRTIREEVKLSEEVDNKHQNVAGSPREIAIEYVSKIEFLENELAEAMEANDMYKAQLKSFLAEQTGNSAPPKNVKTEVNTINKKENEDKLSVLKAELIDIRERYLHMSVKYAEVEGQREQLVLKLKKVNDGSRWKWFS